jgi:large subunit ribosomal protein L23
MSKQQLTKKFSQERLLQVLVAPIVTEKTARVGINRQYAFKVATDACKTEIKTAVEALFNVKVNAVNTLNYDGKVKRFGRSSGRRKAWKKAYVTLVEGQSIEFATP